MVNFLVLMCCGYFSFLCPYSLRRNLGSILFWNSVFLWPPVANYMLLYSTLQWKKIARAPGVIKDSCSLNWGAWNRIDPKSVWAFYWCLIEPVYCFRSINHTYFYLDSICYINFKYIFFAFFRNQGTFSCPVSVVNNRWWHYRPSDNCFPLAS